MGSVEAFYFKIATGVAFGFLASEVINCQEKLQLNAIQMLNKEYAIRLTN